MFKTYSEYKESRKKLNITDLNSTTVCPDKNTVHVAVIIPHRNRLEHLKEFRDHFASLNIDKNHHIDFFIIDQNNMDKFNRGLLLNLGFLIANKKYRYDRYIFHDVDLYPSQDIYDLYFNCLNKNIHYIIPKPEHKYSFNEYLGGIIGLTDNDFYKINGFPNTFFGWGGEDDSLYNRLVINNIEISRPSIGSFKLAEHAGPTGEEYNNRKKQNILDDLVYWKSNGLKQLLNLFINIKKIDSYEEFIKTYNDNGSNIFDSETLETFINKSNNSNSDNINYYFYKIDYLALHTNRYDKILDKNYRETYLEKKLKELDDLGIEYYQHKKNPIFISIIEPLISWSEIETNIIKTFTEPKKFKSNKRIKQNKSNNKIKELVESYFSKYDKHLTSHTLFETIKFIFETYNELLYFRIRNNKLECSYHLYNPENKIDWFQNLKYKGTDGIEQNIDQSVAEIMSKSDKEYYTIRKPHYIPSNNCLLGFDAYNYLEGNPMPYVKEFKEMLEMTIKIFGTVPDCDILINRKDFAYLRKDKKYSYNHLLDKKAINQPEKLWPIASQSVKEINLDIPVPAADEWNDIEKTKNLKIIDWKSKISTAIFRGSSTGCGTVPETNPRLRLAEISYDWNQTDDKKGLLDVAISKLVKRLRAYDQFVVMTDYKKLEHLIGTFLTIDEQLKYKYIFNIEGNAQAYRYPNEFKKGSVIINVKSEYKMWFEPLLINNKHFIEIDNDYKNLYEIIINLQKDDIRAEQIANNGLKFSKRYINRNKIMLYWYNYMININNIYSYK